MYLQVTSLELGFLKFHFKRKAKRKSCTDATLYCRIKLLLNILWWDLDFCKDAWEFCTLFKSFKNQHPQRTLKISDWVCTFLVEKKLSKLPTSEVTELSFLSLQTAYARPLFHQHAACSESHFIFKLSMVSLSRSSLSTKSCSTMAGCWTWTN